MSPRMIRGEVFERELEQRLLNWVDERMDQFTDRLYELLNRRGYLLSSEGEEFYGENQFNDGDSCSEIFLEEEPLFDEYPLYDTEITSAEAYDGPPVYDEEISHEEDFEILSLTNSTGGENNVFDVTVADNDGEYDTRHWFDEMHEPDSVPRGKLSTFCLHNVCLKDVMVFTRVGFDPVSISHIFGRIWYLPMLEMKLAIDSLRRDSGETHVKQASGKPPTMISSPHSLHFSSFSEQQFFGLRHYWSLITPLSFSVPSRHTYTTLINGFTQVRKIDESESFFWAMKGKNIEPTVITYTTMIRRYVRRIDDGLELFEAMKSFGIKPNDFSYSVLLHGLCEAGKMCDASGIVQGTVHRHSPLQSSFIFLKLPSGKCNVGDLEAAADVLNLMMRVTILPEAVHYRIIIENLCKTGVYDEIVSLFILLYENQLFLTFKERTISVWNSRGGPVTSFRVALPKLGLQRCSFGHMVELAVKPPHIRSLCIHRVSVDPAIVDLAYMRDAMNRIGGDSKKINPFVPVDLVIDHSVQIDVARSENAIQANMDLEFQLNTERFAFLKWGSIAFDNMLVVPPGSGIVHRVNLEYLGRVVFNTDGILYPDSVVGTDSHPPMIARLGVTGWGVGGIEAEATMLGQPMSMVLPDVVGFKLSGKLQNGVTATDLVFTVTQMLRKHGIVGKFVEFFGAGMKEFAYDGDPKVTVDAFPAPTSYTIAAILSVNSRCYWLLDKKLEHIVLVHYRDTQEFQGSPTIESNSSSDPPTSWNLSEENDGVVQLYYPEPNETIINHEMTLHEINTLVWDELVVGAIVSWNYPLHNLFNPVLASVFSRNGIVMKVSEHASWSGCFYVRILQSALAAVRAPEHLVEVITGFAETGDTLVSSVDKMIFVGSPGVGKMIMRKAAATFIPVTLELGGKDPFIVCEDVDVPHIAQVAVRTALQSSGQNCAGAEKFYVHKDVYSSFIVAVVKIVKSVTAGPPRSGKYDRGTISTAEKNIAIGVLLVGPECFFEKSGTTNKTRLLPGQTYHFPTVGVDKNGPFTTPGPNILAPRIAHHEMFPLSFFSGPDLNKNIFMRDVLFVVNIIGSMKLAHGDSFSIFSGPDLSKVVAAQAKLDHGDSFSILAFTDPPYLYSSALESPNKDYQPQMCTADMEFQVVAAFLFTTLIHHFGNYQTRQASKKRTTTTLITKLQDLSVLRILNHDNPNSRRIFFEPGENDAD